MSRLSIALWLTFLALVITIGIALLPACGLTLPSNLRPMAWNFCPGQPASLSADRDRADELRRQVARLEGELARGRLACAAVPRPSPPPLELPRRAEAPRPQQTAALKPPPPPPPKVPLPADRWAKRDLSLLEGCWVLGHEGKTTQSAPGGPLVQCTVKAGRICFGGDGRGQRHVSTICPAEGDITCAAPLTAVFADDGNLHTTQPTVTCQPTSVTWNDAPNALTCRRQGDSLALCTSASGFDYEFRREAP
ncbi:MAG TPA: hypothetical protein VMI56_26020 [Reyranella sp.]|nr:hypothetical protein [Reyranella sp.]